MTQEYPLSATITGIPKRRVTIGVVVDAITSQNGVCNIGIMDGFVGPELIC
jgi:hypothetical protein